MESVEIQKTDSHSSHRPWKSPGDSHIPSGPTILLILTTGDQTSFGKVSPMSPGHNVTYVPGRTTIAKSLTSARMLTHVAQCRRGTAMRQHAGRWAYLQLTESVISIA